MYVQCGELPNTDPAKVIQGRQAVAAWTPKNLNLTASQIDTLKSVLHAQERATRSRACLIATCLRPAPEIAFAFRALGEPHIGIATGGALTALALQDQVRRRDHDAVIGL
uniref:Uncharacterized protein n=1 Tax=Solibacter usitatus (strain Ellin6076) TaxID=234267 RepID=Q026G8_SOLUE